jgi:hypothetical protein
MVFSLQCRGTLHQTELRLTLSVLSIHFNLFNKLKRVLNKNSIKNASRDPSQQEEDTDIGIRRQIPLYINGDNSLLFYSRHSSNLIPPIVVSSTFFAMPCGG